VNKNFVNNAERIIVVFNWKKNGERLKTFVYWEILAPGVNLGKSQVSLYHLFIIF
jgi:hypothetical protein